ncbi:hypothetical protein NFI96_000727 [Prochilodus magdalenae]|nr:hypothetical protein NFI96_000727 [Prochilodus magdalenae]
MDEGSLEQAIEAYNAQLQQVEAALACGLGASDQADLLKLKEDLLQLIELTESSLVSVKKSQLLASLENSSTTPVQEQSKETNLDAEFASFYSELSDNAGEVVQSPKPDDDDDDEKEEEEEEEDEEDISGTKVRAPYHTSWGTLEYHNAMVVCPEEPDEEETQVRVLYLYPTHKSMKPCSFFLEGKCRFMDSCRYSHGEVVRVSELRDFLEADLTAMQPGSSCLAKHEDGIWYPAKITEIEDGFYTVKFDSLLLKEAVLEADGVIPPLRPDESSSSSDSENDFEECDAGYAKVFSSSKEEDFAPANSAEFCGWEAHTRGIGSKLLLKMGYELGKGLGKTLSGRVEPVQAVVLPKGRSLDQCAELTQRKTRAAIGKDNPASGKRKMKRKRTSTSTRPDVFDFLNSKLGDAECSNTTSSVSCSVSGVEAYQGGKSTKRSLNVQFFQTTERVSQVEKEIQRLTESLNRRNGRDATLMSRVEEKLSASRKLLQQLKAQEQTIQRAQKKADTHKKMTEF